MDSFRSLIVKRDIPVTLEAPLIREVDGIDSFVELFKEYGLDRWVIGINILNNPMGKLSADPIIIGHLIQSRLGIESIPHIVVSVENRFTLARWLLGAIILDINNLLILGGDVRAEGSISYDEALELIKDLAGGEVKIDDQFFKTPQKDFFLGGALLSYRSEEHKRFLYKLSRGIRFFQTQVTFETTNLKRVLKLIDEYIEGDEHIPILVSIVPFLNYRISEILCGGAVDSSLEKLVSLPSNEYLKYIESILNELLSFSSSLARIKLGIHIIPILWDGDVASNTTKLLDKII